jgi:hypothetical protein
MIGSSGTAVTVWVLPTDEERILVRAAFDLISEGAD